MAVSSEPLTVSQRVGQMETMREVWTAADSVVQKDFAKDPSLAGQTVGMRVERKVA